MKKQKGEAVLLALVILTAIMVPLTQYDRDTPRQVQYKVVDK